MTVTFFNYFDLFFYKRLLVLDFTKATCYNVGLIFKEKD